MSSIYLIKNGYKIYTQLQFKNICKYFYDIIIDKNDTTAIKNSNSLNLLFPLSDLLNNKYFYKYVDIPNIKKNDNLLETLTNDNLLEIFTTEELYNLY